MGADMDRWDQWVAVRLRVHCHYHQYFARKWVLTFFQHRGHFFHSGLDRRRPRASAYDPGYELHRVVHQFLCPRCQSDRRRLGKSSWSQEDDFGRGHLVHRRSLVASDHFVGCGYDSGQKRGGSRGGRSKFTRSDVRRGLYAGWIGSESAPLKRDIDTYPSFRPRRVEDDWSR